MQNICTKNLRFTSALFLALVFLVSGCDKPAGYGGTSSISGTIVSSYFNDDYSQLLMEDPAIDEDVFLVFDDNEIVGDKEATGPSGSFDFTYLRPGAYTVYFLSEDSVTVERDEEVMSIQFELAAGEDKNLGTLKKLISLDYDEGYATISGVIKLINYKNFSQYPFLEVKDISFAQDYEVYLTYGDNEYYNERIRTSYDGYFEFSNLIPGDYKVFTYSEDVTGATEMIPLIKLITISEKTQEIDLGEFVVEKL
jgi:hypothetical protein